MLVVEPVALAKPGDTITLTVAYAFFDFDFGNDDENDDDKRRRARRRQGRLGASTRESSFGRVC